MTEFSILEPQNWEEYELIDSGEGEKLERFGNFIVRRPEPQAIWSKSLPGSDWEQKAMATFIRERTKSQDSEKGEWQLKKGMPEQWYISYKSEKFQIKLRLGLTAFKHVGIFPEQAENWEFIYDAVLHCKNANPKILNLFAYTGGASLVAKTAGADVTHVDSVRQVINWSVDNMEASGLKDIRWIVEDAMKYVKREVKRGKKYHGIILDPPAYGRGPDGEKWILGEQLNELLQYCNELLESQNSFLVLNLYSMGYSALIANNLIRSHFQNVDKTEFGELYISDRFDKKLPLGVFARFRR